MSRRSFIDRRHTARFVLPCIILCAGLLCAGLLLAVNRHARAARPETGATAQRDTAAPSAANDERSSAAAIDPAYQPQQWGTIRSFHGLPSERVRAIAQDREGTLWFGTDAGLARYDGRRTRAVPAAELPSHAVRALATATDGSLWVGTSAGAARRTNGVFRIVEATRGRDVSAILHLDANRTLLAAGDEIIECRTTKQGELATTIIATASRAEDTSDAGDANAPRIEITSLAAGTDGDLYAGTRGRGVLRIVPGSRPIEVDYARRSYYVEAMRADTSGRIWFGAQTSARGAGLQRLTSESRAASDASTSPAVERFAIETGAVRALAFDAKGDLWAGTGGRGVVRRVASDLIERWTFASTAGGLLSDEVYAVCIDREEVVWIGTDRGVCRYDPGAMRSEMIARDPEANFARVLRYDANGKLLCGTNRGLYRRADGGAWRRADDIGDATVYALGEDERGRTLVGTSRGLFVGVQAPAAGSAAIAHDANHELRFELVGETDGAADRRDVRAIERFRGRTYLAVYGAGVELFDRQGRTPVVFDGAIFDSRRVVSLRAEEDRRLWLGTTDGEVVRAEASLAPDDPAGTSDAATAASHTLTIWREPALAPVRGRPV